MPTPEAAKALVDLGSTVMLVFLIALIFVGLFREWWVPGVYYQRERQAREAAETQAERNATSLATLAKAYARDRKRPLSDRATDERA